MKKLKNVYSLAIIFCVFIFATLVIVVVNLMGNYVDTGVTVDEPYSLNDSWVVIDDDREKNWDKLPYYNEYRADKFIVYNYLPDELDDNAYMFLKTNYQSIKVEIEGVGVIYDEEYKETSIFGERINLLSHFVALDESYSGKKVIITSEYVTTFHYPTLEEVLIADKSTLLLHTLSDASIDIYFIGFISFLGVILLILSILLIINKSTKYIVDCLSLSIFTFVLCTWLLSNISSIHFIIKNPVILFLIYLTMLYAILLPIFVLLRNKCSHFTKLFDALFIGMIALMIINFLLAITTDLKLTQSLVSLHVAVVVSLLLCIYAVAMEYYKHNNKDLKALLISGYIFVVGTALALIAYYFPNFRLNMFNYDLYIKIAMIIFIMINSVSYVQQVIIASLKINESEIYRKLAFTDLMTKLKNRSAYDHFLNTLTEEIFEHISIIEVDIDGLKYTNDNFGHSYGDELIIEVSSIIKEVFDDFGECFRIGGDEFEIILLNKDKEFVLGLIDSFKKLIDERKLSNGRSIYVSIGFTFDDGQLSTYDSITNIINVTDRLMYENKHLNKMNNNYEE